MRTIKTTGLTQDGNLEKFPDGQIQNETDTQQGTPVVREIYGDVLTNLYAIMRDSGVTPNGEEDSSTTQYQLLEAFKKFHNELNDIEQLMTVAGNEIRVNFDLALIPDKYVFVGKVTDSLVKNGVYVFNGTTTTAPLSLKANNNIAANSTVMVIIEKSSGFSSVGKIISLSQQESEEQNRVILSNLGTPVSFCDTGEIFYFDNGIFTKSNAYSYNLTNAVALSTGNPSLRVIDAIVWKGKVLGFVVNVTTNEFSVVTFSLSNPNSIENTFTFTDKESTNNPFMYCDGQYLYFTNSSAEFGDTPFNNLLKSYEYDENTGQLTNFSSLNLSNLEVEFPKTTNVYVIQGLFYCLINGNVYLFTNGGGNLLQNSNIINGQLINLGGASYYTNGEVVTKLRFSYE